MPEIAVLTGDIVNSSKLPREELAKLFTVMETAVTQMSGWPNAPDMILWSRFRGDGWQLVLGDPSLALRACLFLRSAIRSADVGFETRIGVGTGPDIGIDANEPGASTGPAFERSGHCLESLRKNILFGVDTGAPAEKNAIVNAVFVLADALSQGWTSRQAEVMRYILNPAPLNQADIGASLTPPISQHAVSTHFMASQGLSLLEALDAAEKFNIDAL